MRRILHASDFSRASAPAFAEAVALAKANRAELSPRRGRPACVAGRIVGVAKCSVLSVRARALRKKS